jgi:hypothetical protein
MLWAQAPQRSQVHSVSPSAIRYRHGGRRRPGEAHGEAWLYGGAVGPKSPLFPFDRNAGLAEGIRTISSLPKQSLSEPRCELPNGTQAVGAPRGLGGPHPLRMDAGIDLLLAEGRRIRINLQLAPSFADA